MTNRTRNVIRRMLVENIPQQGDQTYSSIPAGLKSPYPDGWFKGFFYDDDTIEWWPVDAQGELHHSDMANAEKTGLMRLHWIPDSNQIYIEPNVNFTEDGVPEYADLSTSDRRILDVVRSVEDSDSDTKLFMSKFSDTGGAWQGTVGDWKGRRGATAMTDTDVRSLLRSRLGFESVTEDEDEDAVIAERRSRSVKPGFRKKMMEGRLPSSRVPSGWILPSGEVIRTDSSYEHFEALLDHADMFKEAFPEQYERLMIELDNYGEYEDLRDIPNVYDLLAEMAFGSGWTRVNEGEFDLSNASAGSLSKVRDYLWDHAPELADTDEVIEMDLRDKSGRIYRSAQVPAREIMDSSVSWQDIQRQFRRPYWMQGF